MTRAILRNMVIKGCGCYKDNGMWLYDQFITPESGPLTSPRFCEPGPGNLTSVQTDGNFSITASGHLNIPGQATPVYGDQDIYDTVSRYRQVGLCLLGKFNLADVASEGVWGWHTAIAGNFPENAFYLFSIGGQLRPLVATNNAYIGAGYVINTQYEIAIILRATGAWYCIRGGLYTDWTLIWVDNTQNTANLYSRFRNYNHTGYIDDWRVLMQPGKWAQEYGIATSANLTPTSPAAGVMAANALVEFTWTPAGAETLEISLRQTDVDNRYIVRCSQAGSTIKLIKREAGAEVELETAACAWNAGTVYRIMAILDGTTITVMADQKVTGGGLTFRYQETGALLNPAATVMGVAGFATGKDFIAWPRSLAYSAPWSSTLIHDYNMFPVGDSKTGAVYAWLDTTALLVNNANCDRRIIEAPLRVAVPNATVLSIKAVYEAAVTAATDHPYAILFNFGANEAAAMPTQADWTAYYLERIDFARAKWPNVRTYLAKAWRRGFNAECATLAGWVDTIVAMRPNCLVGHNENIWLEGGDDGVTNTSDGVHYSAPGTIECGNQWYAILAI